MIRAVEKLKEGTSPSTKFFCLSNANEIYIKTILQSKGLENLFDEIVTNPAKWEDNGLLNLRRRVDPAGPQHGCKVGCSPNMCKGMQSLARHQGSVHLEYETDLSHCQARSSMPS
jgi:pyridoxal phosphate phosphatase PHOSPHO2